MNNKSNFYGPVFGQPLPTVIWGKARIINYQAEQQGFRTDFYGNLIRYSDYGNRDSEYGWEMDHNPIPKSMGGLSTFINLQPVHWRKNVQKSNRVELGPIPPHPLINVFRKLYPQ